MKKIYVITYNGMVIENAYTSLKMAADECGIGYGSASKGKRVRVTEKGDVWIIRELKVVRIRGRGREI